MIPPEVASALTRIVAGERPADLESATLDFKRDPGSIGDAALAASKAAVCFANAQGGSVVLGIDDAATGAGALLGCDYEPARLQQRIYELTTPPLLVSCELIRDFGVDVLVVSVPESFEIHADNKGRATRRVSTSCMPLSPQDQQRLREEKRREDWSARPSSSSRDEVNDEAISAARTALARVDDDRAALAQLSLDDLLRALGVLDNAGRLLNAGTVLFCDPPDSDQPNVLYQFRQTPGGEATAVERFRGPLLLAYERTVALAWARRNITPVNLPGGEQIELADFPEGVVREALSNAVLHRDYRIEGAVTVEHSPSAFAVTSPGPLVGGVTPENIISHPSTPRNPCLAAAARMMRLAEETGRGVDRMYREMIRSGRALPVIENHLDHVRVVLLGGSPRTQVARYLAQIPSRERDDVDTLLTLFTLCQSQTVTADELAPIIQKHPGEAEAVLERLAQDDVAILEPSRATRRLKRSEYRLRTDALRALGTAIRYHRRTVDETDRKVIAHLREYGKLTNRTLQNIFDIDVYRARDILRNLVEREIIVRTSPHGRGPGVEYGPGPAFPQSSGRKRKPKDQL